MRSNLLYRNTSCGVWACAISLFTSLHSLNLDDPGLLPSVIETHRMRFSKVWALNGPWCFLYRRHHIITDKNWRRLSDKKIVTFLLQSRAFITIFLIFHIILFASPVRICWPLWVLHTCGDQLWLGQAIPVPGDLRRAEGTWDLVWPPQHRLDPCALTHRGHSRLHASGFSLSKVSDQH